MSATAVPAGRVSPATTFFYGGLQSERRDRNSQYQNNYRAVPGETALQDEQQVRLTFE